MKNVDQEKRQHELACNALNDPDHMNQLLESLKSLTKLIVSDFQKHHNITLENKALDTIVCDAVTKAVHRFLSDPSYRL